MDCLLCYHVLLMVFCSIAFCLLWVGYATPGWLAVTFQEAEARREYTVSSLNRSLWYDVLCPQELYSCETCKSGDSRGCVEDMNFANYTSHFVWLEALSEDKEQWVLWRVLMTLAVVGCVVGFILVAFLVCCRLKTSAYRVLATVGFFVWLIPAIFVWIPVATNAIMHEDIKERVNNNVPHDSTLHIPYSVVIVAVGAFVALIVAIMLLWLTGMCDRRTDKSDSDSLTLSDNSRTKVVEHVRYGPNPYPYYIQEQGPTYIPEQRPAYVYRREIEPVDPYIVRPTEEVVVENPNYSSGRVVRSIMDDRSEIYKDRWYDNRSNFGMDRK